MPNWKKLVVSGSDASLNSLNVNTFVSASSFSGDGSGLTNVNATISEVATISDTFTSTTSKSVTHNFGTKNVIVTTYNDSDQQIIPATVTTTDDNTVTVTFDNATSGRVVIAKGGHIVSGSASDAANLNGEAGSYYLDYTNFTNTPDNLATTGSNQFTGNQYITGSLIPGANETYDLGSAAARWRDLYLSGSTIVLGDTKITTDVDGNIEFKDRVTDNRKILKVDELQIGSGVSARKIKVDNGRVSFTDTADTVQAAKVGHIIPSTTNTYDLGSPTEQFRHIYMSSASLYVDGTKVLSSDANTLTLTTDVGQSIKLLETGADDITLQTDRGNIELKGTVEILSGKKITDSAGTIVEFGDSIGITGSIEVSGTVDGIDLQVFSSSLDSRFDDKLNRVELNDSSSALLGRIGQVSASLAQSISNISTDFADIANKPALISSSAQIASDISGSFTDLSSSLALSISSISTDFADITNKPTLISSSAQIASDISGSFTDLSSSLALSISSISTDFADIANKPSLISSSAQITITESQISDLDHYTDSDVKAKLNNDQVVSGSATQVKTFLNLSATDVGLGNVTNESKTTLLNNAALTGNPTAPTQAGTDDSTKIATTEFVQGRIDAIIGTAGSTLDTLGELSASLAADSGSLASLVTTVGGKLQKDQNLSDLTNAATARTNLGLGTAATTDSSSYATAEQGTNADTAHGWGNHADEGYLTSYTESDPIFTAHTASSITGTDIDNWQTAYGWGDHASAGYLTSYTDTDTNYYLDGITKSGNTLTFSVNGTTNQTFEFGANAFTSTTIPTNNNQLTNGAGYITGYTETDTLASVTGRGADTTANLIQGNIFTMKGSNPYIQWKNASNSRLAYIQHATDLVMSSDTGNIVLDAASDVVKVNGSIALEGVANPEITFNGSSDVGVDMAIKATPEGLDFYEPEDSNKIHFQILDDTGVNSLYGYQWNGQSLDSRYLRPDVDTTITGDILVNTGNTQNGIRFRTTSGDFVGRYSNYVSLYNQLSGGELRLYDNDTFTVDSPSTTFNGTVTATGATLTGTLNLAAGSYEGSIVFGTQDSWHCGIRQHDDADAEMRIWEKNANGMIFIATGYDGEPASLSRPTDGLVVGPNNKVGIGNYSTNGVDPEAKLHVKSSTSGETVFKVEGTSGDLFSVDDDLTGEIFAVSDISGIPLISANTSGLVNIVSDLHVTGDVVAYSSSDERLKKNIKPIENPLEKLKQISGNTFEWDESNPVHKNKGKDIGVIAQEIEKVLPEIVTERKTYKAVQYEKIVALLIESNKALLARVEELESKIK